MDTWGISSEEAFAMREEQDKHAAEQERLDNDARNRVIVTTAFVNAEPEIVAMFEKFTHNEMVSKALAWQILDIMTKH